MIFEFVVFGVILLAVGYWATMFVMGRRDDVLHGKFVEEQPDTEPARFMPHVRRPPPAPQPNKDSLQALLIVIKQDLHDAARS